MRLLLALASMVTAPPAPFAPSTPPMFTLASEPIAAPPFVPRMSMMRVILSMMAALLLPAAAVTMSCRSWPLAVLRPPPPPMLCATMPADPSPCVTIVPLLMTMAGSPAEPPPAPAAPPLPPVWCVMLTCGRATVNRSCTPDSDARISPSMLDSRPDTPLDSIIPALPPPPPMLCARMPGAWSPFVVTVPSLRT
ncbi:hypothetical protein D3C71_1507990 [compost metagenome]